MTIRLAKGPTMEMREFVCQENNQGGPKKKS